MKNVWLINHYALAMYHNRAGRHYWFAKELLSRGYTPTVFAANVGERFESIPIERGVFAERESEGIPFVFVKTKESHDRLSERAVGMYVFYRSLMRGYKSYVKTHAKPDVILASSVHPLALVAGVRIAKKLGIPCICEVRDLWPEAIFETGFIKEKSLFGKLLLAGERWIYSRADALLFAKPGDHEYIIEKGWDTAHGGNVDMKRCFYINNGVSIADFDECVSENAFTDPDLDDDAFRVVYAGAVKNINNVTLIEECAELMRDVPDVRFLVYGDGTEREELMRRAEEHGLTNIKYKGLIHKRKIPYVLSRCSASLLNYRQDIYKWSRGNSSNKLFEYMAAGKPVISTIRVGYSQVLQYGCGVEIKENNAQSLKDAILEMKALPKEEYERMCAAARRGSLDFDFAALTDRLCELLESVERKK